jgi:hypothetical protein
MSFDELQRAAESHRLKSGFAEPKSGALPTGIPLRKCIPCHYNHPDPEKDKKYQEQDVPAFPILNHS